MHAGPRGECCSRHYRGSVREVFKTWRVKFGGRILLLGTAARVYYRGDGLHRVKEPLSSNTFGVQSSPFCIFWCGLFVLCARVEKYCTGSLCNSIPLGFHRALVFIFWRWLFVLGARVEKYFTGNFFSLVKESFFWYSIDWFWLLGWLIRKGAICTRIAPLWISTSNGTAWSLIWRSQAKSQKAYGCQE